MIVGRGLLASTFHNEYCDSDDFIIFASGVSNSREVDEAAFVRERNLLLDATGQGRCVVYFSTCSVYDTELSGTPYVAHKLAMEELVRERSAHVILRLPQVVGFTSNPHTLTNYLRTKIQANEHFSVWEHATRRLIDVDDVLAISRWLLSQEGVTSQTLNVAPQDAITMMQLVEIFEQTLGRSANYSLICTGSSYDVDTAMATEVAKRIGINFDSNYAKRIIQKYYG